MKVSKSVLKGVALGIFAIGALNSCDTLGLEDKVEQEHICNDSEGESCDHTFYNCLACGMG